MSIKVKGTIIRVPKALVEYDKKTKTYWIFIDDPKKLAMAILAAQSAEGKAVTERDGNE